ncbi:unnamed protein product [Parnassius mnemosyne]|uniref:Tc1-like transposase DDE domain-containing protein n=1 Tax=Parnassius mnemosyne TaxID=213953 RepID=A0AAV1LNJ5_9NEOP
MRPYKVYKVQALVTGDHDRRRIFCRWLLDQQQRVPGFIEHVIWMDESTFTRNGLWNRRNTHVYSEVNPHAVRQTGHQTRWSVNVWAGLFKNRILGPVFLPQRLNGQRYLKFINEQLVDILDDLSLAEYRHTWLQHDGAPPHVVRLVRERLNELFDDRWIGRLGPHAWPPRSPDLTPLDFFLWGYVKERVFNRECDSADEMRQRIVDVFDKLRTDCVEDHTMMPRLHEEMQNRAQICLEMNGAQFEPHLIRPRRI